jgi:putative peptidoglycan lipid II flippase
MISKFLNSQSKSVTGAAIIISASALISGFTGLIRDNIFANHFGAGAIMDAYYSAFKIPDLVYNLLIIGALSAGFIPTFTKLFSANNDKSPAWRLANNIINTIGIIMSLLSLLGIIFMPYLIPIITPGFDSATQSIATSFSRIMFGSIFLLSLSMVFGSILQSLRCFFFTSIAPIFYNLGIIIGVTIFSRWLGPMGVAWGVIFGAFLHFILQLYSARANGFHWKPYLNWHDKEMWLIGKLMIPRTLGLAISQINLVIFTIFASLLPTGSVAILNYANNLQGLPLGIIGLPFAVAVFPVLSLAAAKNNLEEFAQHLSSAIRQVLFLVIPVSIIIMLLRAQIVRVILGRGEFDWTATIHTADALALFSLSLFAQSLIPLFARAFYALSNTKTPFVIGIIAEMASIIAAFVFKDKLGVSGLALAVSVGAIINMILLAFYLREKVKNINLESIFYSFIRIAIAGMAMAIIIQTIKYPLAKIFDQQYFFGILAQGAIAGFVGLAVYLIICYLLRVPEFIHFQHSFKKRWLKLKGIKELIETKT